MGFPPPVRRGGYETRRSRPPSTSHSKRVASLLSGARARARNLQLHCFSVRFSVDKGYAVSSSVYRRRYDAVAGATPLSARRPFTRLYKVGSIALLPALIAQLF